MIPAQIQSTTVAVALTIGAGIGVAAGAVLGMLTGDTGLWLTIGPGVGSAVGLSVGLILSGRREEASGLSDLDPFDGGPDAPADM